MTKIFEIIFSSFWTWLGTVILITVIGSVIVDIIFCLTRRK